MKDIQKNSIIAKILASENVMLAIQENLPTASFDLNSRIIRIPRYMFDDEEFTTMVIAHEVAHCLLTPRDDWKDWIRKIKEDPNITDEQKKYAKSCLNIIEDVRIDKLIQRKYPGLKKYYQKSTKFIVSTDFFHIKKKNKPLHQLSFLNRVCVYSKCDVYNTVHFYGVKFSDLETEYLKKIYAAETFQEVCDLAEDILKNFKHKDEGIEWDNEEESEGSEASGESDGANGNGKKGSDRYNVDEEQIGKGENEPGGDSEEASMGGLSTDTTTLRDVWAKGIKEKTNIAVSRSTYRKSGTKNIFEVKGFKTASFSDREGSLTEHEYDLVRSLIHDYDRYVNLFSTKFNQKKRARELVNNVEVDVGRLDPLKLHKYLYDDKIFVRKSIENHQKNHAFIFLIDCSSSMSGIFGSLTSQMVAFHRICDRIDVPYAIYGYTTGFLKDSVRQNFNSSVVFYKFMETGDKKRDIYRNIHSLISGNISMGGTPTSDALLGIVPEIKRFRNSFTPDILNFIVITDGSDGIGMNETSLSFGGSLYFNEISPRGVMDNNSAIYRLLRDHYDVRVTHMDITNNPPFEFLSDFEVNDFKKNQVLLKKNFGGANNVLWMTEKVVKNKSTNVVDYLVDILA